MNFLYRNLTPKQLVAIGLIVPVLSLLLIGWLQWESVSDMLKTRQIVRQHRAVQLSLGVFHSSLSDAESCQFRYILTKNPADLDLYHQLITETTDQLKTIEPLTADNPYQQKYLGILKPLLAEKNRVTEQSLALEQGGDHAGALTLASSKEGRINMLAIEDAVKNMLSVETQSVIQGQNTYQHDFKLNAILAMMATALSLAFIIAIMLLLRRLAQLQSFVTLCALTEMIEYEGGMLTIEEYLKRRHQALATHGQAQIEAERIIGLLERGKTRAVAKD